MKNTALITGASGGIGKEFAIIHAKHGGDLVVVARSGDKLKELKLTLESDYGVSVMVLVKDLTTSNASQEIYDWITSKGITINVLINNAGFGGVGKFHERELKDDLNMIQLNIVALTNLTGLFLPDFVQRNSGSILNVSSTASLMPGPLQAVYFATKAYVTSFSNALTEELKNTNVTVTNLMPGATETGFGETSGMDKTDLFKNTFSATAVAEVGYTAMQKGQMNVLAGLTMSQKIMMKIIPLMPKKMILKQIYEMQKTRK